MRSVNAIAIALLLSAALPMAAEKRRAVAPPIAGDSLAIAFVDGGSGDGQMTAAGSEAWLDLATVSQMGRPKDRSTRIRRRIGVQVLRMGGEALGTAMITVRIESWDGRVTLRIDGKQVTAAPLVIDMHAAVGSVTFHLLEIEVPASAQAGPLAASMTWEAAAE